MIVRRAAVAVSAALLAVVAGCGGPAVVPGDAGGSAPASARPAPGAAATTSPSSADPAGAAVAIRESGQEPLSEVTPHGWEPPLPAMYPGPQTPGEASVSLYGGVDRTGRVHLGGRVATREQRAALVRAAGAGGRHVDDVLLEVVRRPTGPAVDRAVAAVGRYLGRADDGDGSLTLWLLDTTVLAQARNPKGIWTAVAKRPGAGILRDGGVHVGPRDSMAYYGSELGGAVSDAMDGSSWVFPRGSARVDRDLAAHLKLLPVWLTDLVDQKGIRILLTTHAGRSEGDGRADALTVERSRAVKEYLVAHGVAAERIGVLAYGDRQPADGLNYMPGERWAGRIEVHAVG